MTDTKTQALPGKRRQCRGANCGATIVILELDTGNKMPVDPEPSADGRVVLLADGRGKVLKKVERDLVRQRGVPLYNTHFATCPDGPQFQSGRLGR